ncbi:hypothetical protein [Undibacterium sp.]|jgi:hypothetical protein|uniref:hypothetical protein n=1 Tax=Undibacterium sp. TaxID=1914977 RepID=UPI002C86E8D3|nr:hypothetical protein [Undibacterium sp.]HTD04935.1 hypothetical protein [Undibacterium sp.]
MTTLLAALPETALAQSCDVLRAQTKKIGDIICAPEDAPGHVATEPLMLIGKHSAAWYATTAALASASRLLLPINGETLCSTLRN